MDTNVTRNVLKEIKNDDWDIMILHYLGLDHIGHLEGPASPKIPWKLKEMDDVIRKINRRLVRWVNIGAINSIHLFAYSFLTLVLCI